MSGLFIDPPLMQVSELIVKYLERLGIRQIFGIPGAHILPIYDSLYDSSVHSILVKHEQGASFMAGGVARSSGQIAACIATAGPGATNLITGVANAYADHLPVLVITGETPTHIFGKGGLQESSGEGGSIDQNQLFQSITRYHKVVERTDYLQNVLVQATQALCAPQPGPVVLSLPYNLQKEEVDASILDTIPFPTRSNRPPPGEATITQITEQLLEAENPVIVAGYGCIRSGVTDQLSRLGRVLNIRITTSLKGKGAIDEQHPQALGSLGVTSDGHALQTITEEADLLLVLGASFNERTSYLWKSELFQNKTIIQVDHNHTQLEKVYRADIAVEADIVQLLDALIEQLEKKTTIPVNATAGISKGVPAENPILRSIPTLVQEFFTTLNQRVEGPLSLFDDNIIYGQNLFKATEQHHYYPNSGISSLGHALPAAIGASMNVQHPTFALLGDGGFQMCGMELMTAINYNIPVNVVLLNNGSMGLIRKNQFQQYQGRYIDCDFVNPNFALMAQSFGVNYHLIENSRDLDQLFSEHDLEKGINLIELPIDKNAFPDYQSGR